MQSAAGVLQQPDSRLETVRRLRAAFSKDYSVLATERLAAHFVDYKRVYTGGRIHPADLVIIDRSDNWDTSGLPQRVMQFADDNDYRRYGDFGSIIVFERRSDATPEAPN